MNQSRGRRLESFCRNGDNTAAGQINAYTKESLREIKLLCKLQIVLRYDFGKL